MIARDHFRRKGPYGVGRAVQFAIPQLLQRGQSRADQEIQQTKGAAPIRSGPLLWKAKNKHGGRSGGGSGVAGKAAVIGAVERGGRVIAAATAHVNTETLETFVDNTISPDVRSVSTDEHKGYRRLGMKYPHAVVAHSKGEFVRDGVHTQTIDGFWSLLKRQIIGIHHWVSPKHLNRYVAESSWRYNRRSGGEGNRVNMLLADAHGHLTYKALIA